MSKDSPYDMSDVRELASPTGEYRVTPAFVSQVGKAIYEGPRSVRRVDGNQQIDSKASYQLVGERRIINGNDRIKLATP
jgi:hypothetical protein